MMRRLVVKMGKAGNLLGITHAHLLVSGDHTVDEPDLL